MRTCHSHRTPSPFTNNLTIDPHPYGLHLLRQPTVTTSSQCSCEPNNHPNLVRTLTIHDLIRIVTHHPHHKTSLRPLISRAHTSVATTLHHRANSSFASHRKFASPFLHDTSIHPPVLHHPPANLHLRRIHYSHRTQFVSHPTQVRFAYHQHPTSATRSSALRTCLHCRRTHHRELVFRPHTTRANRTTLHDLTQVRDFPQPRSSSLFL